MGLMTRKAGMVLWIVQGLLAVVFLFAGGMKLVMPLEELTKGAPVQLPGLFLRFIGVCEVDGALGLILPSVSRIRTGLTPLAACGLIVIMVGAVVSTAIAMSVPAATFPLAVGMAAAFVAYGRTHLAPITQR